VDLELVSYVVGHETAVPAANPLQFLLEGISSGDPIQQLHAPVAAKRNEVHAARALSNWFDVHSGRL
jgi:hypothetical protein